MATNTLQADSSYGDGSTSGQSEKSPFGALLKNLGGEKKPTKDGQPPKRRGPKPDSKPALTRRQELNRQAQRTHRERKEMYIKALEQEVLRLKEVFANTSRERDAVAEENVRLKELLAAHGIKYDFSSNPIKFQRENSNYGPSSSGSISGSYAQGSESSTNMSPPTLSGKMPTNMHLQHLPPNSAMQQQQMQSMAQLPSSRLDYDQIGIDFVLTYDSQGRPIQIPKPAPYPSPPPQR